MNLLTTLNPEPQIIIDVPIYIYVAAAGVALTTYIFASIVLRPIIIFKMKKNGSEESRSINYTTEGEISYIYRYIPFLIYKKFYNAKFLSLDDPYEEYGEYFLPYDLPKLRTDIEIAYQNLEVEDNRTENYYEDAADKQDELQMLNQLRSTLPNHAAWRRHPQYNRYVTLQKITRRLDIILNDAIEHKYEALCIFRKKETVYMMYDKSYKRRPTYSWEFE